VNLSIVIVNWNTRDLLAQCLMSIREGDLALECYDVETFIVDNASTDGSGAMVQDRFPEVHLIENEENVGFAKANNQAIRQSHDRYVLLLNSDTEVCSGALEAMIKFMESHPRAGACGPRLLNADGTLQPSCHPMLTPWREFWRLAFLDRVRRLATYDMSTWDLETPREVEVIKGACLMLRQEALDEVGLLDERYFMYTEEMDLCHRLRKAGWKLYWVPQAEVVHYGEASSRQIAEEMYLQLYRSKVLFHRKFGGEQRAWLFKLLLALAYAPRWATATLGGCLSSGLRTHAGTYKRMLIELPDM
jgi:GT2 family glycosyltransferase